MFQKITKKVMTVMTNFMKVFRNAITVHSVIYNLTDKTALWIPNEHYGENEYIFKFSAK